MSESDGDSIITMKRDDFSEILESMAVVGTLAEACYLLEQKRSILGIDLEPLTKQFNKILERVRKKIATKAGIPLE